MLIVGQFAMVAVVPVVVLTATVLRNANLRALRWWAVAVGATYASGLAAWAIGPDRAGAPRRTSTLCTRRSSWPPPSRSSSATT
ncbi:hypothetical protein NKG05_12325 [Oerskovia sp. M15]